MSDKTAKKSFNPFGEWDERPFTEKVSIYKKSQSPFIRRTIIRRLSYFCFTPGTLYPLNKFFLALHDSSCKHEGSQICVASTSQQEAFALMDLDRMLILANDNYLMACPGWPRLIESLGDTEIQARVIIDIRPERLRKEVLNKIKRDTREGILKEITQLQRRGYHNANEEKQWFCMATSDFNSTCGVCTEKYEVGDYIINKTCGEHTTHERCAEEKWGPKLIDWRATPCQLCPVSRIRRKRHAGDRISGTHKGPVYFG